MLQVQLRPGSHVEFDGQVHWDTEFDPVTEYVEFGHCTE